MKEKPNKSTEKARTAFASWVTIALVVSLPLVLAACSGTAASTGSTSPAPTAVMMTGEPAGSAQVTAQTNDPAEDFETKTPELTPWPEPKSVGYTGPWLDVAEDKDPAKYPALKLASQAITTTWGALRLPGGWTMLDAEEFQPIILDSTGRAVGLIEQIESYPDEPWLSLMPEDATPMLWETPAYKMDARVITMLCDTPSADSSRRMTIRRQVSVIVGGPVIDDGGTASYQVISLTFDKAYVDGDLVEYVLSNKVIDEIARSFVDSWSSD